MIQELKNLIEIGPGVVAHLNKLHLDLSHLWYLAHLKSQEEDTTLPTILVPSPIISALERKNFIANGLLTEVGRKFLDEVPNMGNLEASDLKKTLKKAKGDYDTKFIEWWNKYPSGNDWTDDDTHGNKYYLGTRTFKTKKDECQVKYLEALSTPGITHELMLEALEYEVNLKKSESRTSGTNKLSYMLNTYSYLFQKQYEGYIEMLKNKSSQPQKPKAENTDFKTLLI